MLAVLWSEISADADASPSNDFNYRPRPNRCCRSMYKFKRLFKRRNKNLRKCSRQRYALLSKIKGLKSALDAQKVVITVKPPNLPAPSVDQLVIIRDRAVEVLRAATFTNTTQPPPFTTTTTPKTTTTPWKTTTTPKRNNTPPAGSSKVPWRTTYPYKPTTTPYRTSSTQPWRPLPADNFNSKINKYERYYDNDDLESEPDFEDGLENEDEGGVRKRRSNRKLYHLKSSIFLYSKIPFSHTSNELGPLFSILLAKTPIRL